ncbi:MAG: DUF4286 family protein [Acidobacteria bacterium]|nr:DUF4286 family protein [Acidobacteriota bacterium]
MAQIYEVTAVVAEERTAEWETYMADEHIPDVLATGYFAAAFFAKEGNTYTIAYHVDTPEDIDRYLAEHATRLRADVVQRFGDSVQTSRRVLEIVKLSPGK